MLTPLILRRSRTIAVCTLLAVCFIHNAQAQTPVGEVSRCEQSLTQQPVPVTIETCREELAAPVSTLKRVNVLENLGKAYLSQNEPDLAMSTWREAAQYIALDRKNPSGSEQWARLQVLVAQTLVQVDKSKDAEAMFMNTAERIDREIGRFTMPAGIVQDALGSFYALQNQAAKAEEAFRKARIIHEIRLGKMHPKTIETRMNYAVGLLDMGQEPEAKAEFQVLADVIANHPDFQNQPIKAEVLTFLGTLQMREDDLVSAAKNYQTAFEVRQAAFGPDDVRTSQSLNNLGVVLYRAGDLQRAEKALSRAYIIRKDALGDTDALTLSTQKNLQAVIAAQNAAKGPTIIQQSTPPKKP
ncbi:tetratricopeptide repeat protein [Limnobacter humi]|uniref:Tetratricopeptide repeat protein n=1 Tax=Limnobacter humi TaxID=1778671 RepID=A0ABT1WEL4_9BURK|nr:tetratricopeptide repeat protein [Limnobacter humi]MCQ8895961.1 tetratricopeptide repeat protein [Limnobacter humi]